MFIHDNEYIIRCGCGDLSHPVWLGFEIWHFKGADHYDLDIQMHIDDVGFFGRLKNAIFYLFKNRKFWHYGAVTLDLGQPEERGEVLGLVKFLNSCMETETAARRKKERALER